MKFPKIASLSALSVALAGTLAPLRAQDSAPAPAEAFVPPTAEAMEANGLLPPDKVLPPGHHKLLERWTKAFGLTMEQELWIEPQLHAEESLTKPVIGYKALSDGDRQQILLIIKLAARRQIRTLLTPSQQKLMDQDMADTKAAGK